QIFEYNASGTAKSNNTASTTVTSTLAAYPDLLVKDLVMTPADAASGLQSGAAVTLSWVDENAGAAGTTDGGSRTGSLDDYVVRKNTDTGETLVTDRVHYDATVNGPLAAHASRPQQDSFRLPEGTRGAGHLQVSVTTDYYNDVFEQNSAGTGES